MNKVVFMYLEEVSKRMNREKFRKWLKQYEVEEYFVNSVKQVFMRVCDFARSP